MTLCHILFSTQTLYKKKLNIQTNKNTKKIKLVKKKKNRNEK